VCYLLEAGWSLEAGMVVSCCFINRSTDKKNDGRVQSE
jgi:hypothetical protein